MIMMTMMTMTMIMTITMTMNDNLYLKYYDFTKNKDVEPKYIIDFGIKGQLRDWSYLVGIELLLCLSIPAPKAAFERNGHNKQL
jgi:hypothetical protein